jgi:hypothetical protein
MSASHQLKQRQAGVLRRCLAFVALFLLCAPGCGSTSVNKSQYDRLRLGMTQREVEDILGNGKAIEASEAERLVKDSLGAPDSEPDQAPDIDASELRGMRWGSDSKNITVIYRNDRLFRAFHTGL